MLTFDEAKHEYCWNGAVVPHLTGIIGDLTSYDMVNADQLENARQKGTAVHKMIEYWATGVEMTLPDWMLPVQAQWLKFVADTGIKVIASERRCYHKVYGYACTLDLAVTMRHKPGLGIVEVKRSFMAGKAIGLQTAAQAMAWEHEGNDKILWRGALKINETSSYRFEEHENKKDWPNFVACLMHYNLLKECSS